MLLNLPETLPSLVSKRFAAAKESGGLVFTATQLAVLSVGGIQYQLRYCPALAKKPINNKPDEKHHQQQQQQDSKQPAAPSNSRGKKPDPFENPPHELLIADIPFHAAAAPRSTKCANSSISSSGNSSGGGISSSGSSGSSHILVLNKFPVIPNHFILATRAFRCQTDLLEDLDLEVAFACISEWAKPSSSDAVAAASASASAAEEEEEEEEGRKESGRRLFAFFNSGDESGASQPHRHLQFLPIEEMGAQEVSSSSSSLPASSSPSSSSWVPLIDRLCSSEAVITQAGFRQLPNLPFKHFALPIPENPSSEVLHRVYLSLYRAAVAAADSDAAAAAAAAAEVQTSGPAAISYNLAMTESVMMICPRRSEVASLKAQLDREVEKDTDEAGGGDDEGKVSLNGTILAGTLMVKGEAEWNGLRENPERIDALLETVGMPVA